MDFPVLPISEFLGLTEAPDGGISMPRSERTLNHVGGAHAGAQFVLAETASGKCLKEAFPELFGKTLPVLRRAEVKYRGAGMTGLTARASVAEPDKARFLAEIGDRGRAMIAVKVSVADESGTETMRADYEWFVQRLPGEG